MRKGIKNSFKVLTAAAAVSVAIGGMTALAATSNEDIYNRITNSQGNIVQEQVRSSRYAATSSIKIGVGTSSGNARTSPAPVPEEDNSRSGPGYREEVSLEEKVEVQGPKVSDVRISETYHEDFDIYEQAMGNVQFFYTNVSNGGITDQPVRLEIPANMTYVMEKDGVEIPYSSGQYVRERGSYMVKLSVVEDDSLPFSEQTVCKAVFRFRIQEKAVREQVTESSGGSRYGNASSDDNSSQPLSYEELAALLGNQDELDEEALEAWASAAGMTEESTEAEPEETEPETEANGSVMDEDGFINEEGLENALAGALGEGYGSDNLEGYSPATGLASAYDESTGYYRHELITGAVFYSDVPNGMLTNHSVMLLTNDDIQFRVLKDGQEMEFTPGTAVEEAGSYQVYPSQDTTVYAASYHNESQPTFAFRIVKEPVSDLGIYTAPQGAVITGIWLDGQPLEVSQDAGWFLLEQDGAYEIALETEAGTSGVTFERDTVAPRFYLTGDKTTARFSYVSNDVSWCRILSGGNEVYSGAAVSSLETPGEYQIQVYDAAGNVSSASFEVVYRMNKAAIVAIVLVLLLVVVLVVFIKRAKKQLKVR